MLLLLLYNFLLRSDLLYGIYVFGVLVRLGRDIGSVGDVLQIIILLLLLLLLELLLLLILLLRGLLEGGFH